MKRVPAILFFCFLFPAAGWAQDLDRDGLADSTEQQLLDRFAPTFMISAGDCDGLPSRFAPDSAIPTVVSQDGTIYGQAFPLEDGHIELHYYHLWSRDCGRPSHALDAEHVSTLLAPDAGGEYTALYWYAAAHEDTVCDASYAARAGMLGARRSGARIWISGGKHASFLEQRLCSWGCGADRCEAARELRPTQVVNIGEPGAPLNGASWVGSDAWPLAEKLDSDFTAEVVALLEATPDNEPDAESGLIQGEVVRISSADRTVQSLILTADNTTDALVIVHQQTGNALTRTEQETGSAVWTSLEQTGSSLKKAHGAVVGWFQKRLGTEQESAPE